MEDQPKKVLHIAVFPWLAFGHISPFFELAKFIAQKGHKVSFISTPRNIKRLPKLPPNLQPLLELVELPLPYVDNLPEDAEATRDIPPHIVPYLKIAFDGLEEPLTKFLERSTPDCIIYDFAPYWLPPISSKLGISCIFFTIFSAFGTSFFMDFFDIKSKQCYFDESSNKVALQSFEDKTFSNDHCEQNESGVSDIFRLQGTLLGADFIAIRSCVEIEGESLKLLENKCKKSVIPVGLMPPSLHFSEDKNDDGNWHTILKWLDKQEKRSVVYVAFGSEVTLSNEEFTELAMGLELSGFPFFWVLKKHDNSGSVELQDWIENKSKKNGLVWSSWAPQLRILAHESIGGFLTHCGWSSVIESLQVGCPLIMLPFHNEQGLIARLVEEKMMAGVKVSRNEHDGTFTRDSLAKALKSVLLEEEGKIYRSKAKEMSKIVGDKELQQKYIDDFVNYLKHTSKH